MPTLNTMDNPSPEFRDETARIRCKRCGNWFALGQGMLADSVVAKISLKHLELCEGDVAATAEKLKAWWAEERPGP